MKTVIWRYILLLIKIKKVFVLSIWVLLIASNIIIAQNNTLIVSAFFGLDDGLLNGQDGMPVNFKYSIDGTTLSASDFEVVSSAGNTTQPRIAALGPANENGENRTVLLIGDFGTAGTNPPVKVRIVDDLYTMDKLPEESAWSEVINLNGSYTTNIVPLADGPSMFFAQKINGSIDECESESSQTIQVAWDGGITPHINGDTEGDLFKYYIGYSDSSGVLIPHKPISISDINDNDNFHQLCFSTQDSILKISIMEEVVKDPNGDPNLYNEIEVSYGLNTVGIHDLSSESKSKHKVFLNPFSDNLNIVNLRGNEYFIMYNLSGQKVLEEGNHNLLNLKSLTSGIYFLTIESNFKRTTLKLIKK